jgi:hypothetical protein
MGVQCTQYRYLGKPSKIRSTSSSELCDRCMQVGYTPEDAQPTEGTHVTTTDAPGGASELCSQCRESPAVSQMVLVFKNGEIENTPLCEGCQKRLFEQAQEHNYLTYLPPTREEPRPLPQDIFKELFGAAKTLFKRGIAQEELIIPTLAFANRASALPELKALRDQFAELEDSDTLRDQFVNDFYQRFRGLIPITVSDEVLVLRRVPMFLNAVRYPGTTVVREVVIDVFMRSVKPAEVAEHYERWLVGEGLTYDESSQGMFSYAFPNAYLAMTVGPGKVLNEGQVARMSLSGRQPVFPPPQLVAEQYRSLKGSVTRKRVRGFAYALGGRQSGPTASPDNLIPACVGWYLREPGRISDKHRLAGLLNQHLLAPCGKREVGVTSDNAIWKNIDKVDDSIKRVELALQESWEPRQTSVSETHT